MRHPIKEKDLQQILASPVPWERFNGATVVISGAYGFVVAYLVEALLYLNEQRDAGVKVIAVVRNPDKANHRFADYKGRRDLAFVFQDVCDPVDVEGPADYVIHGASWASPSFYGGQPVGSLLPNVVGTRNLLDLAVRKKSRGFLFFSSAEIYGKVPPDLIPTPETYAGNVNTLDVRSCYAESKRMGETMCVAWHKQFGVPATMARIFHTYGPGMALDDGRVFADFVSDLVHRRNIRLMSAGTHQRAFCHLADSTPALFKIMLEGQPGTAYNMGNDEAEISIRELADVMVGLFPEWGLKVERTADQHQTGYLRTAIDRACPDTRRLRELGWRPSVDAREGFRRTVLSYLDPQ
jgi:nucleoside-diphosphate-sugar epimerase